MISMKVCHILAIAFAVVTTLNAKAGHYTVSTTRPSGSGSLLEAITCANLTTASSQIDFGIPTTDPGYDEAGGRWTIRLAAPLPNFSRGNTTIDGDSKIAIVADKANLEYAFGVISAANTIRGFAIGGFKYGCVLYGANATSNTVEANQIGLIRPNETGVIMVEGASINTIARNIISGNTSAGIYVSGRNSNGNTIRGNRIGTDAHGVKRVPNGMGILFAHAATNSIADNIISGNEDIGILLVGKGTVNNSITGNLIGVDATGTKLIHNDKGIVIKSLANDNVIGGLAATDRNIVSGNLEIGIYIEAADGNQILGNYLGTDITGMKTITDGLLVQGNGIEFNTVAKNNTLGGLAPGARNIISGHKVYGIVYYGHCSQNATIGNFIGADVTGSNALPNATGICVDCASHHNDIAHNVISGNLSYGLFFVTRGTEYNTLRGNKIGTTADGTAALPNDIGMVISTGTTHNRVGGTTADDRNIISGNRQSGLLITNRLTENNEIVGNYIGADITGAKSLPNKHGVIFSTYPKANRLSHNRITGNSVAGVILCEYAESNVVISNTISGSPALIVQDYTAANTVSDNASHGIEK